MEKEYPLLFDHADINYEETRSLYNGFQKTGTLNITLDVTRDEVDKIYDLLNDIIEQCKKVSHYTYVSYKV